jgi:hypothetical protein
MFFFATTITQLSNKNFEQGFNISSSLNEAFKPFMNWYKVLPLFTMDVKCFIKK